MNKIEIKNLYLIFGSEKQKALRMLKEGKSKNEILKTTDCTIAVKDANLDIHEGEFFVIMGLSGSGKSTLLRCINRLIKPTKGQILINGKNITTMSDKELLDMRRHEISMVFQNFGLLPHRSVLSNIAFGLELQAFSALDPLIRVQMQDEMLTIQSKMKKTIIFITHDLNEAIKLGDRIAIMKDGEIVQVGTSEEILTEPANDYVARFVENVDRSKIITAGSIMITRPAVARLRKEGPEVLIRKMKERDITVLPVIDENDKLIGEITLEDTAILRHKGIKSIQTAVLSEVHSVTEDTKIEDLLPLITKTNSPIYVVNEERELKGLVPLSSIVVEMTGKDKNEINELIQNAIEL